MNVLVYTSIYMNLFSWDMLYAENINRILLKLLSLKLLYSFRIKAHIVVITKSKTRTYIPHKCKTENSFNTDGLLFLDAPKEHRQPMLGCLVTCILSLEEYYLQCVFT